MRTLPTRFVVVTAEQMVYNENSLKPIRLHMNDGTGMGSVQNSKPNKSADRPSSGREEV